MKLLLKKFLRKAGSAATAAAVSEPIKKQKSKP